MSLWRPSYLRKNGCCFKVLYCTSYFAITVVALLTVYIMVKSRLRLLDHSLLYIDKCPACFGVWENVCQAISSGALKVKENYFWSSEGYKGVWYGMWDTLPVVVKRLGYVNELELLDQEICRNTTQTINGYCDVHENVWRSFLNPGVSFKRAVMQFMECPCEQFASLLENKLKNKMNVVQLDQKIMAVINLHFNQEFLFLQIFSKRYPNFLPTVYGACGRVIVVEYVGASLSTTFNWSWQKRVRLSIKMIQLARAFTRTDDNMALYMHDVSVDNFAVDKYDNVKLIDCEHVLIVDMSAFNHSYATKSEDFCAPDDAQCLTFIPQDLCKGQAQDHNYYAICRNILSSVGVSKGLLHSPPTGEIQSKLKYLLDNCAYSKDITRERAIDRLEKELYTLLDIL